jgi:hypothetical protein
MQQKRNLSRKESSVRSCAGVPDGFHRNPKRSLRIKAVQQGPGTQKDPGTDVNAHSTDAFPASPYRGGRKKPHTPEISFFLSPAETADAGYGDIIHSPYKWKRTGDGNILNSPV